MPDSETLRMAQQWLDAHGIPRPKAPSVQVREAMRHSTREATVAALIPTICQPVPLHRYRATGDLNLTWGDGDE